MNADVQVSCFPLSSPSLTLFCHLEDLVGINASRDLYFDAFLPFYPSLSFAYVARLFRLQTFSLAFGAYPSSRERTEYGALYPLHLACAPARKTFFHLRSGFCHYALAPRAYKELGKQDKLFSLLECCLQGDLNIQLYILPAL